MRQQGAPDRLIPRWLFLRALGAIYFSAFFSLVFQIRGLIGPAGILPASRYLQAVEQSLGHWQRVWYAPTLLWFSSGPVMLSVAVLGGDVGLAAACPESVAARHAGHLLLCAFCRSSAPRRTSPATNQMACCLRLDFIAFFFAPPGFRPGLGRPHPASRASLFLAAVGVVSHLLRVRRGEASKRGSRMAPFHGHG